MEFDVHVILLDIEGTTSSIRFVHDVMFPFVRRELEAFLALQSENEAVIAACEQIAQDAGYPSLAVWVDGLPNAESKQQIIHDEVVRLMDGDVKATGLKSLQGLIWKSGFESGELVADIYDDVLPAISRWRELGISVRIYSSGSIGAQKLFFGHTAHGSLLDHFAEHYDTTIGSKKEAQSYTRIAESCGAAPSAILFVSDVVAELDAAKSAGLQTVLSNRPGNAASAPGHSHPSIHSFAEIAISVRDN